MMQKFLSRKFLISALVAVSSILAAMDVVMESPMLVKASALLAAALTALGYSIGQGGVDKAEMLVGKLPDSTKVKLPEDSEEDPE